MMLNNAFTEEDQMQAFAMLDQITEAFKEIGSEDEARKFIEAIKGERVEETVKRLEREDNEVRVEYQNELKKQII